MEERWIPGCAIALIHDHRIVWHQGFGVTNRFTNTPVNTETVFEVASNSKIVTAYIALRLVGQGKLTIDAPLNSYLAEPWVTESAFSDSVTLRHVLSHSSGLGHNEKGKEIQFPPGSGFYYSNQGFSILQEVIEEVMRASLESVAVQQVFDPLGMEATSYVNRKDLREYSANGHINGGYIIKISFILWLVTILLTGVPGIILHKIIRKRWIPKGRQLRVVLILLLTVWLISVFVLFGLVGWLKYAWLLAFCNLVLASSIFLLVLVSGYAADRWKFLRGRKRKHLKVFYTILVTSLLILLTSGMKHIPVPKWSRNRPMAEASLRTNVHDMATFLLELANPVHLSEELAVQVGESQINLHPDISWGLGAGILHSPQGNALWQWGQNVDFQSITIIYPEPGFGVVVFTNSDWNQPDVAIEIANRALGGDLGSLKRASHLEFNMDLTEK